MTGETPDADIANIWQSEYDMAYEPIKEKRFKKNKTKTTTTIKRIQKCVWRVGKNGLYKTT